MHISGPGKCLRIFIGEAKKWRHIPLYQAIVEKARGEGLAGATVLRGVMGFGASSRLHAAHILRLSEDLPMIVEIVDKSERIEKFLPLLDEMVADGGLITIEDIEVIKYTHSADGA
jgi:PII-like signaling protein